MRIVGLDVGRRRIGIAVSDPSCTLARPVGVVNASARPDAVVGLVADEIDRIAAEDDEIGAIVVGLPRRLDGSATEMTAAVQEFATRLQRRMNVPVMFQDERLTSVEAESRLATRERDWRARKLKLDAAAAAIILQDYLDTVDSQRQQHNR